MTKTYCDCCKSLIEDGARWKVTIERNNNCISDLTPHGKFVYDICPKCAAIIKTLMTAKFDTTED